MRKAAAILVVVIGAVALGLFLKGNSRTTTPTPAAIENRIPKLKQRLTELEKEIEQAVSSYAPKSNGQIDDLAAPADEILRGLPGVVQIEFLVKADKPTRRC